MKRILLLLLIPALAFGQLYRPGSRSVGGIMSGSGLTRATNNLLPFTDSMSTDGALGPRWTAPATWVVSGGTVTCTPTLGPELLTNGNMETWTTVTNAGGWFEYIGGTSTVTKDSTHVHGGSYAVALNADGSTSTCVIDQPGSTQYEWYQVRLWAYATTASKNLRGFDGNSDHAITLGTTGYAEIVSTHQSYLTYKAQIYAMSMNSTTAYIDDASSKRITFASTIATVNSGVADVDVSVGATRTLYCAYGLVVSYADTNNLVLGYGDGFGNMILAKRVAGTWTNVISGAVTYVAGAAIRVTKSGNNYSLFYNGSQVGSTTAITDAAIVSNTRHGIFSTIATNALDNFSIKAFP